MESYTIPECIYSKLEELGYHSIRGEMEGHIRRWYEVLRAYGDFWNYTVREDRQLYKVHRRTIHPAQRVSDEWASLILNDDTVIATEDEQCNEWLEDYLASVNFVGKGQQCISDAFSLGTSAWVLWVNLDEQKMIPRRYDARMIIPLFWDEDGISECAFCSKTFHGGRTFDQLQTCVKQNGSYHILTYVFFDGEETELPDGWVDDFDTRTSYKPFAVIKPAIPNRYEDFSPYGQAIFADHVDILHSVDLAYDAIYTEVDMAKMRVFVSDMLLEKSADDSGRNVLIPFGKNDMTVFRSVSSTEDIIKEFAPSMRTAAQKEAYRLAVQAMGDCCGFGSQYFDIDKSGGIRTATEVSSDNSALMRNIRRHENLIGGEIEGLVHTMLHFAREFFGVPLQDEGIVRVSFDDSIITDTMAEKQQDLAEVGTTLNAWEYRVKWYGEDEETAKANVPNSNTYEPDIFEEQWTNTNAQNLPEE